MINLTAQERDRFAAYLRQEAETADGMAEQTKKIGMGAVGDAMAKKLRTEAAASLIIAGILTSSESMEIHE